jgi:hypothetical protein
MNVATGRTCTNNLIASPAWPEIRIQVESGLQFIGVTQFILYKIAEAEVFIFAEAAANKKIQRQLIVQFENFLPHTNPVTHRYNYVTPHTLDIGGTTYKTDLRVVPISAFGPPDPESDTAQINAFIEAQGYTKLSANTEQVVVRRIMKELGEDCRHEILWIYREALNPPDLLYTREEDSYLVAPEQTHLLADFERRALSSFNILS